MIDLLQIVSQKFPNARIIIPTYFPLVSDQTPWATVLDILKMAFPRNPDEAQRLYRLERSAIVLKTLGLPNNIEHPIRHFLAKRSQSWTNASNQSLSAAVEWINQHQPILSSTPSTVSQASTAASKQRAWFVDVKFGPEWAYETPGTYLWALFNYEKPVECAGGGIAKNVWSHDEVFTTRACKCELAGKGNDLICLRAGFMHPNKEGAEVYFEAIKN
jgi:hypothetical protein